MRIFIGMQLEVYIKDYLCDLQKQIKPYFKTGRMTRKENLHLTLKFIGDVDEKTLEDITKKLKSAVNEHEKIELQLDRIDRFHKKNKLILWMGVKENNQLMSLFNQVEESLILCGFEKESRSFTPHITLGREVRLLESADCFLGNLSIIPLSFGIENVTIFESKQVKGQLSYVPLSSIPLRG